MNNLKLFFNKDVIKYLFLHFFCVDSGFIYLSILIGIILIIHSPIVILGDIDSPDITQWIGYIAYTVIFALIMMFLKIFGMVIYYNNDYERVKSPLVIKLFELLKINKNHSRLIFLLIVTLPYNLLLLFNVITSSEYFVELVDGICLLLYIASSMLSYKILFYYWDIKDYIVKTGAGCLSVIKYTLKQIWLFVLISGMFFYGEYLIISNRLGY